MRVENIKPAIGARIHAERSELLRPEGAARCLELLEDRAVLVFPGIGLADDEQLALTDLLGDRVNFTKLAPGGDVSTTDVYTVSLDPKINTEPEYVLGTYFWHMDGLTSDIPPPRISLLSARSLAPTGGQTEFANTFAAYDALSDEDKAEYAELRVMHSVAASVREVTTADALNPIRRDMKHEHPLVRTRPSGRKSLVIGYTVDSISGRSQAEARALGVRLNEWAGQPAFSYRHHWQEGDLVMWDNMGALHRVVPYAVDSGRRMHRTSVAGVLEAA